MKTAKERRSDRLTDEKLYRRWQTDERVRLMRAPRDSREYFGVVIFRSTEPGYRLPYTARMDDGENFASDTLAGIKQLIRERIRKESKS